MRNNNSSAIGMLRSAVFSLLMLSTCGTAYAAITFKQGTYSAPAGPLSTVTATYAGAQTAGGLNVVIVAWNDSTSSVSSVTDSQGNAYSLALGPTIRTGAATQSIYYARNITAASAGSNIVTVTFSTGVNYPDVRILEYSGIDTANPLHAARGSTSGSGTTTSSGAITVTVSNALLIAANYVEWTTTGAGTSFTNRMISNDGSIAEDRIVAATGSYTGTAPQSASGWWIMQMVAFKAASSDTQAPTAPASLSATVASSTQINLSWTASTDNVGVTGYQVERCSGASCTTFAQIATPTTTTFNNTGLTAGTSYSYRVRAMDAAGNLSAYSNTASATTTTADTTPPTSPATISATVVSSTQINLSWSASTDNVGVTGYQVDRCQGAGCATFAQIGTSASASFNDTGLTASTSYSYRVRATDAAGNVSANSSTVTTTTQAPPDTTSPSTPTGMSATPASSTQINLTWTASTDNVGVTGYQIDRCLGASCTTFAQIGTSSTTTFNDAGLTASTSYGYRVRATDAAGNVSANSATASATTQAPPDTTPPSAPTGLGGTAASSTQVNLTWTASTDNVGVTGYQVDRCEGVSCTTFSQIGTSTTATYSDTGLTGSTSYSYRVRATDAASNVSANSSTASTVTPVAPPSAPVELSAVGAPGPQTSLAWTDTSGGAASGFKIERRPVSGSYVQIGTTTVTAGNATTFIDTGVASNTTYYYRVRATNAGGDSAYSNEASAATSTPGANVTANTLTFKYDPFGNLIQTNASGVVTNLTYDRRGRKKTLSDPDLANPGANKIWKYDYDALGEMVRQTDALGQISAMVYDLLGRMIVRTESDPSGVHTGATSKWFYDCYPDGTCPNVPLAPEWDSTLRTGLSNDCSKGKGKLCYVSGDNGYRQLLTYDSVGRPSETNTKIDTTYRTAVSYDAFSRVSGVTYPQDSQPYAVTNGYNSFGHLATVTNSATQAVIWQRQSVAISQTGTVVTDSLGTSAAPSVRTYDAIDRLTSAVANNGSVMNLGYAYDPLGNVAQRSEATTGVSESFSYDSLNRLTLASGSSASGALVTRSLDYDATGNILYKSDAGAYTYNPAKPHAVAHVSGSVNADYFYDDNGNLTSGAGRTVTYTTFNLPHTIVQGTDQFEYRYNAEHQRAFLQVTRATGTYTTIYLHPGGGGSLFYEKETKPDGTIEHRHYVNAAGLVGVHVKDNHGVDEMRFYHVDGLGSIVAVSNDSGTRIEQLAYEAFGKRRFPAGTADPFNSLFGMQTDRGFTGHEHLDEIGLIHMNGRVYDPLLGRFMTADPTVQSAGNLQTYNRYSYASNNPLAFVDPTGYGWRSRISHFINSVKAFDPISNMLSALHGVMHGNLAEAMLGLNHASSPAMVWTDRYIRNHPSLAPYYEMAMSAGCSLLSAGTASMGCAAGASAYVTGLMGGGNSDILKTGAISFATAYAMNEVGNFTGHQQPFLSAEHFENIAGHALVGCASAAAGGGSCRSGAISAGAGSFATPLTSGLGFAGGLVATAIVGGTASELAGGSFANGAKTSAFGYLFNYCMSPTNGCQAEMQKEFNAFQTWVGGDGIESVCPECYAGAALAGRGMVADAAGGLFGKGGILNSNQAFRIGIGRDGGESVFRIAGESLGKIPAPVRDFLGIKEINPGTFKLDLWNRGPL